MKKDVRQFLISRFFRIWPALAAVLAVSAFIVAPILSTSSRSAYFPDSAVQDCFLRGLLMDFRSYLPGVFQGTAMKAVNGSLCSIPFEVAEYISLIVAFLSGLLRSRWLSTALFLAILIAPVMGGGYPFQSCLKTVRSPCLRPALRLERSQFFPRTRLRYVLPA